MHASKRFSNMSRSRVYENEKKHIIRASQFECLNCLLKLITLVCLLSNSCSLLV